jgi:ABC-type transporter Mla maintaining outer membrane lipid asymmetry ATPase subunit MlaF
MPALDDHARSPMVIAGAPLVTVRGLVKAYDALRPLRLSALEVWPGERVALSGLDATAAEVFVNLLNGAILPDEGEIRLFGRETSDIRNGEEWFAVLDRLGIVSPRAVLLEGLTVRQNLALPFSLEIDIVPPDVDVRLRQLAVLAGVDDSWLDVPVGTAPRHVRMRVHLARALARGPELLLLEHPTAALDRADVPGFARAVREISTVRRVAVVAATEDDPFARGLAGRMLKLHPATGALAGARGWRRWW